ncbi:MAG TPA: UPF0149 family protein [Gammaproteobacteria bacterium]|nr:UPF0149 family protein [Gammaproteobacteria bacterium]
MNFSELNNLLIQSGAGSRAAECHGFLCGYLCVTETPEAAVFEQYLFADSMDSGNLTECIAMIIALAGEVQAGLNSANFTLQLLLPDENTTLGERGEAFVQWCESFLSGLGVGGLTALDLLSVESREVIQDIYKICRLDLGAISDTADEEERAFAELTEYVRMGAILLHEELHQSGDGNESPEVLH